MPDLVDHIHCARCLRPIDTVVAPGPDGTVVPPFVTATEIRVAWTPAGPGPEQVAVPICRACADLVTKQQEKEQRAAAVNKLLVVRHGKEPRIGG
jgi:hypothetical protein